MIWAFNKTVTKIVNTVLYFYPLNPSNKLRKLYPEVLLTKQYRKKGKFMYFMFPLNRTNFVFLWIRLYTRLVRPWISGQQLSLHRYWWKTSKHNISPEMPSSQTLCYSESEEKGQSHTDRYWVQSEFNKHNHKVS